MSSPFFTDINYGLLEEWATKVPLNYEISSLATMAKEINPNGLFLEFGVFKGGTINRVARAMPDTTIHGFDSFRGLPKTWILSQTTAVGRQSFDVKGTIPEVEPNVLLYPGFFNRTIPEFLKNNNMPISFMHLDCDLYESTVDIFTNLENNLLDGSILAFDDIGCGQGFNHPAGYLFWKDGQAKAFIEMIQRTNYSWRMLSRDLGDNNRCAIQIRRK